MIAPQPPRTRRSSELILFVLSILTVLTVQANAYGVEIYPGRLPSAGAPWTGPTTEPGAFVIEDLDWYPGAIFPGEVTGDLWDGRGVVDLQTNTADIVMRAF